MFRDQCGIIKSLKLEFHSFEKDSKFQPSSTVKIFSLPSPFNYAKVKLAHRNNGSKFCSGSI